MNEMGAFGVFLCFVLLFTFQTTLLHYMNMGEVHPDLVIIAAVFLGFAFSKGKSVAAGSCLGLIQDTLSGGIIGMNMLSKGLAGYCAAHLRETIILENIIAQCFLIFGATILEGVVFQFLSNIFPMIQTPEGFWEDIALLAFYNALVSPFGFLILKKVFPPPAKKSLL